jgi:hypothetical protein
MYKNTLVFLSADGNRLKDLEQAVRQHLAWKSISEERLSLNLDPFQIRQVETKLKNGDDVVETRIPETYQWLLVPGQTDPKGIAEWTEIRLQGSDSLANRVSRKLKNDGLLIVTFGGSALRHELDRVPLWRGNHVEIKQLAEDFATYLYLPRLQNDNALFSAIRDGINRQSWRNETFAFAEEWDDKKQRYVGLVCGTLTNIAGNNQGLLVKPDIAALQYEKEKQSGNQVITIGGNVFSSAAVSSGSIITNNEKEMAVKGPTIAKPKRFHGSVKIDTVRIGRDATRIGEEILQHLVGLPNAEIEVTLEIQAKFPEGAPEKTVRDVSENCRTLKFDTYGFEES